jgi:hypothetical protein
MTCVTDALISSQSTSTPRPAPVSVDVTAIVDLAREVERLGQVGNLHQARDAAFDHDIAA